MTKIKLLSIALISLLLINLIVGLLFLFNKPPRLDTQNFYKEGPRKIIIDRLQFDDKQIVLYGNLIDKHKAAITNLDDSIRVIKNILYQTLNDNTFKGKDSLINQLSRLRQNIEYIHYNHFADIRTICKSNQLDKYKELTKEIAKFFTPEKSIPPSKD
jgi:periplasmic protein CpxP/Spy